jgi:hypothetical protein
MSDRSLTTSRMASGRGRTIGLGVLTLILGFVPAGRAAFPPALNSIVVNGLGGVLPDGGGGFAFQPTNDLSVRALGFHLDGLTTITNEVVELLDSTGQVLASAGITLDIPETNGFRYQTISPVFLPAGSTNYVVGYDLAQYVATGKKVWVGTALVKDTPSTAWFDATPPVSYLGCAQGSHLFANSTNTLFYGANFKFSPPVHVPLLAIAPVPPDQVKLSWPTEAAGFVLQATTDLLTQPMTNVIAPQTIEGTNFTVVLTRSAPQACYRLFNPN